MIREKINQILDSLPENELENVFSSVEYIHKNFLFRENLLQKGVIISELFEEAEEIIQKWDKIFAKYISEDEKNTIYYNQYKWHIFSFEKQNCLREEIAREAFDAISKDELFVMYQNSDCILQFSNAINIIASDFNSEQDIYIFDKNFTWTYVLTHESTCGPYFYKVE